MGRMFCYLWHEKSDVCQCKFGEKFVFDGEDPIAKCKDRIRESLGVRKDKFDEGSIVIDGIWDVSEWAKLVDRNRKAGRMDDYIRAIIGFRKGSTGEVHLLDGTDMAIRVNKLLAKVGQPLPTLGASQWQFDQAVEVVDEIGKGKKVILAELCARFGKTTWAGILTVETEFPVTIIASYVLTSFASFMKDLSGFEQFRDLVLVDSADDDYQKEVNAAIKDGKQVIVFLSMCGSSQRQDRIDFLFGLNKNRLIFIDEADFGAHTKNQSDPFVEAKKKNDVVILMTGTNGERACGSWEIDHYLGTTYAELLMERAAA